MGIKRLLLISFYYIRLSILKILLFYKNNLIKNKSPSANAKGLEIVKLPRQDDFRNFCLSDETEKVYQRLEEVISIC
jgi:hypothetical protein